MEAAIEWEPEEPSTRRNWWSRLVFDTSADDVKQVVPAGFLGRGRRPANYCDQCGAVLTHPKDAEGLAL